MAELLSKEGYWVTFLNPKNYIGSQPADLIACKDNIPYLIDCKTSKTHLFPIHRIEQNQWNASKKYLSCGNSEYILAIKYNGYIYLIPIDTINPNIANIDLNLQMKWK